MCTGAINHGGKESEVQSQEFKVKDGSHIVIKSEDVIRALDSQGLRTLTRLLKKIADHRKRNGKEGTPGYYVVNRDEPYADAVLEIIKLGELHGKLNIHMVTAMDRHLEWLSNPAEATVGAERDNDE